MNAVNRSDKQQTPSLVVGLGKTGWSVVRYLRDQNKAVVVTDSREIPPHLSDLRETYPEVQFVPKLDASVFPEFAEVIVSPGVATTADNAVGDIELFLREAKAPVIAITGSNGKSTVTMLVTEMLSAAGLDALAGGNIGTPALDLLSRPVPDCYVLELSSFQLETTFSLQAASAVVLNISEDHMDRYLDLPAYAAAKHRIYSNAKSSVINRGDAVAANKLTDDQQQLISFGLDQPAEGHYGVLKENGVNFLAQGSKRLAAADQVTMSGAQNLQNILAAMALITGAGFELGMPMISAALAYPGLPHRCETVSQWQDVVWVNDSKGTNVGATLAAIAGARKPVVLIAGGQGKGADFSELGAVIHEHCKAAILFGEDAQRIANTIGSVAEVHMADSLERAVALANTIVKAGDTVLFSPACASFDMFKSYEDRGDRFREIVRQLAKEDGYVG